MPETRVFRRAGRGKSASPVRRGESGTQPERLSLTLLLYLAAHKAAYLAGESPVAGIDCLPAYSYSTPLGGDLGGESSNVKARSVKGEQSLRAAASSELCSLVRNLDGEPSISGTGAEPVRLWRRPEEAVKQQSGAIASDRRGTEGGTKGTDRQIKLGTLSGTPRGRRTRPAV